MLFINLFPCRKFSKFSKVQKLELKNIKTKNTINSTTSDNKNKRERLEMSKTSSLVDNKTLKKTVLYLLLLSFAILALQTTNLLDGISNNFNSSAFTKKFTFSTAYYPPYTSFDDYFTIKLYDTWWHNNVRMQNPISLVEKECQDLMTKFDNNDRIEKSSTIKNKIHRADSSIDPHLLGE